MTSAASSAMVTMTTGRFAGGRSDRFASGFKRGETFRRDVPFAIYLLPGQLAALDVEQDIKGGGSKFTGNLFGAHPLVFGGNCAHVMTPLLSMGHGDPMAFSMIGSGGFRL
jgi:hypothetical protein